MMSTTKWVLAAWVLTRPLAAAADGDAGDSTFTVTLGSALLAIVISGGFGGLVDGLQAQRSYHFRFGKASWEWGSMGDVMVGVTAAVAIFAFAENVFGSAKIFGQVSPMTFVKIIAWGVISGYAGRRMLETVSHAALSKMVETQVQEKMQGMSHIDQPAEESLSEAKLLVTQHLQQVAASHGKPKEQAEQLLTDAQRKYELVLKADPANVRAALGLANVFAYRGDYCRALAQSAESLTAYEEAIKVLGGIIKRDPNVAKAYYNRACFKALSGEKAHPKDDAAADLAAAVKLDPHLRDYARGDADLVSLRGHRALSWLSVDEAVSA